MPKHKIAIFVPAFIATLCALLIIGSIVPRFLGYAPALLGLIAFLGCRFKFGSWPALSKPAMLILGPILLLASASIFWAVDPSFAVERCLKIALLFVGGGLLVSTMSAFPADAAKRFSEIAPIVMGITILYALFELYTGGLVYHAVRPDKSVIDATNLSYLNRTVVIIVLSFFPVFQTLRIQGRWKCATILALLMIPVALKTDSQSAQIGFIMGMSLCLAFPYRIKHAYTILAGLMIGLVLGAPFIAHAMYQVLPPLMEGSEWLTRGASAPARMEIWDFISMRVLDRPLFGHGIEATRAIEDFTTKMLYHPSNHVLHPHNFVLQIWIEFGAAGAILLSGILAYMMRLIAKAEDGSVRILLPVFCTGLTMAGLSYGIWQGWWLGTLMMVSAYMPLCIGRKKSE